MKRLLVIIALMIVSTSCGHYSTADGPTPDNFINADINTVWEKTLETLKAEGMTLEKTNKDRYFVEATQYVPRSRGSIDWTQGPEISIRLTPKSTSEGSQTKIRFKGVFNYFQRDSVTPVALEDEESERYIDELIARLSAGIKTLSESHVGE
ncbi:MAG: hypothetical protein JW896_09000 [Deltaproteobacteria bacterium]|nr:hypothetical protein [Deltaproteobacteria bacterium]